MVKDLFHLLSCHHFLYKAVNASKTLLLPDKIFPVAAAVVSDEQESREESARMEKIAKTKVQVEESNKYYNQDAKPGSLAAKANMVAKYNERQEKGKKK